METVKYNSSVMNGVRRGEGLHGNSEVQLQCNEWG